IHENFRAKDLKNEIVKGEDNRIVIVQYDLCPDGNSIRGIRINVNDEEVKAVAPAVAGNSLELNKSLKINEQLVSTNGEYHFIMQQDGNACIYRNKSTFVWGTMTHGKGGTRASFTKDGNLQILTDKYVFIWGSAQTRTTAVKLVLENTGDL